MGRTWTVEIDGKKHLIKGDYGMDSSLDCKILVDENEVYTWKAAQFGDVPEKITIEIGGKPAVLQRKGLFTSRLELFIEGQRIKPV